MRQACSLWAARKTALLEAARHAEAEAAATGATHATEHAAWQESLDKKWRALKHQHSDTVFAVLAHAFAENEAAAAIGADGSELTLVVR
jgi:hypothetical protein